MNRLITIICFALSAAALVNSVAIGMIEQNGKRLKRISMKALSIGMAVLSGILLLTPLLYQLATTPITDIEKMKYAEDYTITPFSEEKDREWYEVKTDNDLDFLVNKDGYPINSDGTVRTKKFRFTVSTSTRL